MAMCCTISHGADGAWVNPLLDAIADNVDAARRRQGCELRQPAAPRRRAGRRAEAEGSPLQRRRTPRRSAAETCAAAQGPTGRSPRGLKKLFGKGDVTDGLTAETRKHEIRVGTGVRAMKNVTITLDEKTAQWARVEAAQGRQEPVALDRRASSTDLQRPRSSRRETPAWIDRPLWQSAPRTASFAPNSMRASMTVPVFVDTNVLDLQPGRGRPDEGEAARGVWLKRLGRSGIIREPPGSE